MSAIHRRTGFYPDIFVLTLRNIHRGDSHRYILYCNIPR
jgi:hypothetical protein